MTFLSTKDRAKTRRDILTVENDQHILQTDVCSFHKDCGNGRDESKCADCDFENGVCGWASESKTYYDYFKWTISRAGRRGWNSITPSWTHQEILWFASSTAYMYSNSLTTKLNSATLRNAFSTCTMEFWYNILSTMAVSVNLNRNNKTVQIWVPEGKSDEIWTKGEVFLGRIPRGFTVLSFVAERKRGDNSHVAVDDIAMKGCETLTTGGPGQCNADQFSCKNSRCIPMDNICDYTDDCGNFEDEKQETCVTALSRCSFDQSYCSWVSDNTTAAEWQLRGAFATLDQGPTRDHTTGSSNGQFLYLPGRIRPVPARIMGLCFNQQKVARNYMNDKNEIQIRLYYDIRGQGPLSLQIKVRTELNGEERVVWTREDPTEGYYFTEDRFTFNETQSFQVIVEGSIIISKGKTNYIALDDISFNHKCVPQITPLPTLPPEVTTLPPTKTCKFGKCDFHEDMCGLINLAAWSSYKWQRRQAESFSLEQGTSVPDTDSQKNKQGYFAVLTGKSYFTILQNNYATPRCPGATSHACPGLEFYYHFNS
ncbi:apical endosomal glycoprotein [Caerostris extrusa]|uniref:Apical endosomal glycoprotein n=1 Tax=Caerostris extrusa TaxID=172846 RepID=A0AAV4XCC1_CAEEX|nr:apical endosomal glycoprotein [Caerostris extrusa]